MIRALATAAILSALVAGGSLYAGYDLAWRNGIAAWSGPVVEASPAAAAWPVCTAMTGLGAESDWAELDPDFAAGKKALVAENWNGAILALKLALLRDPRNADILNYIGYAYSRLRELGPAMGHFQQALIFNTRHRSAREHLGELYLALDEPLRAKEQLAALKEICLISCAEFVVLEREIATYKTGAARSGPTAAF